MLIHVVAYETYAVAYEIYAFITKRLLPAGLTTLFARAL